MLFISIYVFPLQGSSVGIQMDLAIATSGAESKGEAAKFGGLLDEQCKESKDSQINMKSPPYQHPHQPVSTMSTKIVACL